MANGYQIIVTPRAEQKLEDIVFYVKENASEHTAEKVRKGILETIKSLAKMPTAHPLVPEISTEQVSCFSANHEVVVSHHLYHQRE